MTRAPDLARFNPAQPGTRGMKLAATGLLVAMAAVFIAARTFEPDFPWLSWIKAFAEAGMVGGSPTGYGHRLFRHRLASHPAHRDHPRNKDGRRDLATS